MATITLRAKTVEDSGIIYQYWSSGNTGPAIPDRVKVQKIRGAVWQSTNQGGASGAFIPIAPGEKVGIRLPTNNAVDWHTGISPAVILPLERNELRMSQLGMPTASGFFRLELYNATTKAFIAAMDQPDIDVTTLLVDPNQSTITATFKSTGLHTPVTGGVILVAHFLAGGVGIIQVVPTTNVTPAANDGQMAKQTTGGSWSTNTIIQPKAKVRGQFTEARHAINASTMFYTLSRAGTSTGTSGYLNSMYARFQGITIPIGATINSAIMTIRSGKRGGFPAGPMVGQVKAVDDKAFALTNPTTSRINPVTANAELIKRTAGVPWLKTTGAGTLDSTKQFTIPVQTATALNEFGKFENNFDLTTMVQNLVNKFDYNNDSMFFNLGLKPGANATSASTSFLDMQVYQLPNSIPANLTNLPSLADGRLGLPKETTATSQGVSTYVPKLVIDFTAGLPVDFEFEADALLFLGEYLRSCSLVDARLFASGPAHEGFEVAEAILAFLTANGDKTGFELLAGVINPTTGRVYTNHAIKSSIGFLESTNQITGNPFVPPPSETGAYNFKKTTWTIV